MENKKFCTDYCRQKWWNKNLDKVNKKANYRIVCMFCKKSFISYGNKNRKYCSHECYITEAHIKFLKCQDDIIKDFNKLYWNILLDEVFIDKETNVKISFIV